MNVTVRTRLVLLLVFLNLLLAGAAGYGWYAVDRLNARFAAALDAELRIAELGDLARRAEVDFKIQVQEWKNILLRGQDPAAYERYMKAFQERSAVVRKQLEQLRRDGAALGMPADFAAGALAEHDELDRRYADALKGYRAGDPSSAFQVDAAVRGIDRGATQRIDDLVKLVHAREAAVAKDAVEEAAREKRYIVGWLVGAALVAMAVSLFIGWLTIAPIARRLDYATSVAQAVATGDLTSRIEVGRDDELGRLLRALREMNDSLCAVVSRVRDAAETVAASSAQIAAANADLASRTEEQAASLEETASSVEQMTAAVAQNAGNTHKADDVARAAADVAGRAGNAVQGVVRTIEDLQQSSGRIAEISSLIDSIAFQTNILALNAAVEAARAGEQGRGFAVVASEVRALAQRSAEAAREIKALIAESVSRVDGGARDAVQAGERMGEVVENVNRVSAIIADIAAATREQSSGIGQVNQAVSQLDKVTQSNAALVEESSAASEQLKRLAREMADAVAFFRTATAEAHAAIQAAAAPGRLEDLRGVVGETRALAAHEGHVARVRPALEAVDHVRHAR